MWMGFREIINAFKNKWIRRSDQGIRESGRWFREEMQNAWSCITIRKIEILRIGTWIFKSDFEGECR